MDIAIDGNRGQALEGAENWSLKCLMASCLDFAEEMTALQHAGSQLGVLVIITPSFIPNWQGKELKTVGESQRESTEESP